MTFYFIAFIIIAAACSAITIKNLVGYGDFRPAVKIAAACVIILCWFGFIPLEAIKNYDILPDSVFTFLHHILYFMLACAFVLFICLMLRDLLWFLLFSFLKVIGHASWEWDPNNSEKLNKANFLIIIFSILICIYSSWSANSLPNVEILNFYSDKITGNLKIIQVSDLHLSRTTSSGKIKKVVDLVNALTPDIVVLTGDIIADKIEKIEPFMEDLRELGAPYGVVAVMGDHEFYNNVYEAKKLFEKNGISMLFNGGVTIKMSNIFIAGIPDYSTMSERINLWRTIYKSDKGNYRVLLSHSPLIIDALSKELFDIVLSGHTHGGQFFPFHWIMQKANHYLSGQYNVNGIELFVSRGVGTFGPKMRLFAPADIAVINLRSK